MLSEKASNSEDLHPRVKRILNQPQIDQKSPKWFELRQCMLTASRDVHLVGVKHTHLGRADLFLKKVHRKKPLT